MELAASLNRLDRRGIAALALVLAVAAAASTCAHHHAAWDAAGATARVFRPIASEFPAGTILYVDREAMVVQADGKVFRGALGTERAEHAAGALVYRQVPPGYWQSEPPAEWSSRDRRTPGLMARIESDAPVSSEKFAAASMLALIAQDR